MKLHQRTLPTTTLHWFELREAFMNTTSLHLSYNLRCFPCWIGKIYQSSLLVIVGLKFTRQHSNGMHWTWMQCIFLDWTPLFFSCIMLHCETLSCLPSPAAPPLVAPAVWHVHTDWYTGLIQLLQLECFKLDWPIYRHQRKIKQNKKTVSRYVLSHPLWKLPYGGHLCKISTWVLFGKFY